MEKNKVLKDFARKFKNKNNNQESLTVSSKKLKKFGIDIDDLMEMEVRRFK